MSHLLVVGLVLGQDLPSEFLFALVDIRVKLVSVLSDGKLLIIVNRDIYFLGANGLLIWVVELSYVRVLKGLIGCQSLVGVEVK